MPQENTLSHCSRDGSGRRSSRSTAAHPRVEAALIHLAGCVAVALILLWLVFAIWYPGPLDQAVGAKRIFFILLGADVVLGPLITLIIYKPGKRGLFADVCIVVLIQMAALAFGLHKIAMGRPAWLVFAVDRFDVVRAYEVSITDPNRVPSEFKNPPRFGPRWVAAISPLDAEARQAMLLESLSGGPDLQHRPEYYQSLNLHLDAVKARMRPLEDLGNLNSADVVRAELTSYGTVIGWLPLMSSEKPMVVLLDQTGRPRAVVDLKPW